MVPRRNRATIATPVPLPNETHPMLESRHGQCGSNPVASCAERATLSALEFQISDLDLKQRLQQASSWLDDVENIFLRSAMRERRTPEALSRWLSYAAVPLQFAKQHRREIQKIVSTYGTKAKAVGA